MAIRLSAGGDHDPPESTKRPPRFVYSMVLVGVVSHEMMTYLKRTDRSVRTDLGRSIITAIGT